MDRNNRPRQRKPVVLLCVLLMLTAISCPLCPVGITISLNEIPEPMNGARPIWCAEEGPSIPSVDDSEGEYRLFRLLVPEWGFTIDLDFQGMGLDPQSLVVTSARPLANGAIREDENLVAFFEIDRNGAHWRVPEDALFPAGPNLLRASIADCYGSGVATAEYRFDVHPLEPYLDPFPQRDRWLLLWDRDDWTTTWHRSGLNVEIVSIPTPNGIADFDEALEIAGFRSAETGAGAADLHRGQCVGTNAILRQLLLEETRRLLRQFCHVQPSGSLTEDSVNIDFLLPSDPGAPTPGDFDPNGTLSLIAMGGDSDLYGQAEIDWNNQHANDLTDVDEGLFVTNLLRVIINTPIAWIYLGSFLPGVGTPVGESDLDAVVLAESFETDARFNPLARIRYNRINTALNLMAQALAAGVAHEVGHSLGLVPNKFPPQGLFGGESNVEFAGPRTTLSHLDTDGNNLMAAGVHGSASYTMIDLSMPFFNELNLAYLRRRLIYWPQFQPSPFAEHPMLDLQPEEQIGWLLPEQDQLTYTLTLSHHLDGDVVYDLELDYLIPISEPIHVEINPTSVLLGPQGEQPVALTISRSGVVHMTALDVRVTARRALPPWADAVSVVTFIPPVD